MGGSRPIAASILWAAGSAVAFGVFLTALPKASAHGRAWALFDARLALIALLALWAGRELAEIRFARASALFAIPGVMLVVGTIMYTTAAAHGQLPLVSVLGSLFPVVTVGLGVALLGERLSRAQSIGVAAALAGIALIALARSPGPPTGARTIERAMTEPTDAARHRARRALPPGRPDRQGRDVHGLPRLRHGA